MRDYSLEESARKFLSRLKSRVSFTQFMNKANMLIKNANIITLDGYSSRAGSLAVTNGMISGIWPGSEPPLGEARHSSGIEVMDLGGAVLIPGFVDTHNHILGYGLSYFKVNCSTPPNRKIGDIVSSIALKVKETMVGEWIQGYGYDDTLLVEQRHPTREDLDIVSSNHPVIIVHISGHLAVANSYALKLAGIQEDIADPKGGFFGRDRHGKLNGVLYEAAVGIVRACIPIPTFDQQIKALSKASKEYVAHGITTNTDANVTSQQRLLAHTKAAESGVNPMRTRLMISHSLLREDSTYGGYSAEQMNQEIRELSNGHACLDSAKLFQDGSIQGLTGALRKPYFNAPDEYGDLFHHQVSFQEEILDLHKRGFRIAVHGNGDRAIGSIIDAYDFALKKWPKTDHRHRIEHVQMATSEDLNRMASLGVAGSFFINHVYYWGDRHERIFLGSERAQRINPLREAIARKLLFTLHSDCPVTPISPLFSVWAAVNRITREGKVLGPGECCSVESALRAMTIEGAKLNFNENVSGSIEIGKHADFAVLEADPFHVHPEEIKDIKVTATFIGGSPVYVN